MPTLLVLTGLTLMAMLPATFFRRGRLNARWWLTAAPFALAALTLVAHLARGDSRPAQPLLDALSVIASTSAVALMLAARAAHAVPVGLWHQGQLPGVIVARGPYSRIRHPFYAAFLLLLLAAACALPGPLTVIALAWALVVLTATAAGEERALLSSPLGDRYRLYIRQAGRFLPRLRRPS